MSVNSITDLTNTRWQLNDELTGSNVPYTTKWNGDYYSINAKLDDNSLGGFAFVSTIDPEYFDRPEITAAECTALLLSYTDQTAKFDDLDTFFEICDDIGLVNFDLGLLKQAYYLTLSISTKSGIAEYLSDIWAENVDEHVLTIYGGADVKNTTLISWLENNATFIDYVVPREPSLLFQPLQVGEPYRPDVKRISFADGWNKIKLTFQSNISLNYVEARVTSSQESTAISAGRLGAQIVGSITPNTNYDLVIDVNDTTFAYGSDTYTIAVYAKSASDGTWSESYFLLTVNNLQVTDDNEKDVEVLRAEHTTLPYDPTLIWNGIATIEGAYEQEQTVEEELEIQ